MSTTHTPGSWTIAPIRDDVGRYLVEQRGGTFDTSADAVFIARCSSEADARLIAAAPDMLHWLRLVYGMVKARGENLRLEAALMKIIAKATGGTP